MNLTELRNAIDSVDSELLQLFLKRMELSQKIGEIKLKQGIPVFDSVREEELLNRLCSRVFDCDKENVLRLFSLILKMSRERQESLR